MKFRPCIDIHNGRVKQIVGGSLRDDGGSSPSENYVSDLGAAHFASLYEERGLSGGHIIMLNKPGTPEYEGSKAEALSALKAYPGGMQVGGGITADNAAEFVEAGASHVIVTSYVFDGTRLDMDRLMALKDMIGRDKLVLDLSCRYRDGAYYVVTDRWQTFTEFAVNEESLKRLGEYCDEYLIHGVDVEGLKQGIDERLLDILASVDDVTVTYAGGVRSYKDIERIRDVGKGRIDFTVGSALSLFGGDLDMDRILEKVCE